MTFLAPWRFFYYHDVLYTLDAVEAFTLLNDYEAFVTINVFDARVARNWLDKVENFQARDTCRF